jgi:hypothetical protein
VNDVLIEVIEVEKIERMATVERTRKFKKRNGEVCNFKEIVFDIDLRKRGIKRNREMKRRIFDRSKNKSNKCHVATGGHKTLSVIYYLILIIYHSMVGSHEI